MLIQLSGYRTQGKNFRGLIVDSAEFYANELMRKDLARNICIDIQVVKKMEKRTNGNEMGTCLITGECSRPREFELEIDGSHRTTFILKILAHEIVHVCQFATRKWIQYEKKDIEQWKGEIFEWEGLDYRDLPWEAEAIEKEDILFHNLIKKTTILDDYIDRAMHRDPEIFYEGDYAKPH
jgi:hypothetical protein